MDQTCKYYKGHEDGRSFDGLVAGADKTKIEEICLIVQSGKIRKYTIAWLYFISNIEISKQEINFILW